MIVFCEKLTAVQSFLVANNCNRNRGAVMLTTQRVRTSVWISASLPWLGSAVLGLGPLVVGSVGSRGICLGPNVRVGLPLQLRGTKYKGLIAS